MYLSSQDFWGQKEKNRGRQVLRVFLQQGDNGFCCKQLFDKIQKYCFRDQRPLPVSLAPVYFRCSYPPLLGEEGTKTVSFISPAVIGSCRNDGWQYFTILLELGCASCSWLCWWHPLSLCGPAESHGVSMSCLWIPKGLLCVTKLWGIGHAQHPFCNLGNWKVKAEVAAAIWTCRRWSGGCELHSGTVPMLRSSFTLVGLSAFLDPGQCFPCRALGDQCILSWLC